MTNDFVHKYSCQRQLMIRGMPHHLLKMSVTIILAFCICFVMTIRHYKFGRCGACVEVSLLLSLTPNFDNTGRRLSFDFQCFYMNFFIIIRCSGCPVTFGVQMKVVPNNSNHYRPRPNRCGTMCNGML